MRQNLVQVQKVGSVLDGVAFDQVKHNGEIAYARRREIHAHKREILELGLNRGKREALLTKRNPQVAVHIHNRRQAPRPKAIAITIDHIDSFSAAKKIKVDGFIPRSISEDQFKRGVQSILREPGEWKDFGGELLDLATTRVEMRGKRFGAAFAFKGPGMRGPLVPKKMGASGDQIQRMFMAHAQVFFVQYHEDIKLSILQLLRTCAVEKSEMTNQPIYYGIIDGSDSHRLVRAYPEAFGTPPNQKKRKTTQKTR